LKSSQADLCLALVTFKGHFVQAVSFHFGFQDSVSISGLIVGRNRLSAPWTLDVSISLYPYQVNGVALDFLHEMFLQGHDFSALFQVKIIVKGFYRNVS